MQTYATSQLKKSHHYVAQEYLRPFCDGETLHVFDKRDGRSFTTGTAGVACGTFFYDLSPEAVAARESPQTYVMGTGEEAMCAFEEEFQRVRELILAEGPSIGIANDVRERLAHCLAIQWLRTESARREIIANQQTVAASVMRETLRRELGTRAVPRVSATIDPAFHSAHHLAVVFDPEAQAQIAVILLDHAWVLVEATDGAFVTSDTPVARHGHAPLGELSNVGFQSRGVEIVMPITPKLAVVVRERTYHTEFNRQDGRVLRIAGEQVAYFNRLQVASAVRFIFGNSGDFSTERTFLERYPRLRNRQLTVLEERSAARRRGMRGQSKLHHQLREEPANFGVGLSREWLYGLT